MCYHRAVAWKTNTSFRNSNFMTEALIALAVFVGMLCILITLIKAK